MATLAKIKDAIDLVKSLPINDEWILFSPDGRMYKGNIQQIAGIIMHNHPLFKPKEEIDLTK